MKGTTTIRISTDLYKDLKSLSENEKITIQSILETAINKVKRESFIKQMNKAYENLRNDEKAWNEELKERENLNAVSYETLKDF